jgi:hypothetical protein
MQCDMPIDFVRIRTLHPDSNSYKPICILTIRKNHHGYIQQISSCNVYKLENEMIVCSQSLL